MAEEPNNVGRPLNVKSPEIMYALFSEYKNGLEKEAEKWLKVQYVGKEGDRVTDPVKIPYTLEGFKRYCWEKEIGEVHQYFVNQNKLYDEFVTICSRIKEEIRENQIIGGMNGFFNPSITQRLNGLKEATDNTNTNFNHEVKAEFGAKKDE